MIMNEQMHGDNTQADMTLEQAQQQLALCKKQKEMRDNLIALEQDPKFESIFLDLYLNEEPSRITSLLMNSQYPNSRVNKAVLDAQLMGISAFRSFCITIREQGNVAEHTIPELEQAISKWNAAHQE